MTDDELQKAIEERDRLVREVLRAEERRQLAECKDILDRFTAETVAWRILKSMGQASEYLEGWGSETVRKAKK